jgi:hypothetical protein
MVDSLDRQCYNIHIDSNKQEHNMNDSVKNIDAILVKMGADHPGDIIADILHWCDHYKEDFADLVRQGQNYHSNELEAQL